MDYREIIVDVRDGVALVTLNRPEKLNSLGPRIVHELIEFVDRSANDDAIRVTVVTGAGRAFCSGADLTADSSELAELNEAAGYRRVKKGAIGHWGVLFSALGHYPKPLIAAVNGIAAGGGLSIALVCDIRLASSNASFIAVFVRRALTPDTGASYLLPKIIGPARASEMLFTGGDVAAHTADAWGLVNRVVEPDRLLPEAMALAARIARGPSVAIELAKRLVQDLTMNGYDRQLQNEAWANQVVGTAEDRHEGLRAFIEKRQPVWRGR